MKRGYWWRIPLWLVLVLAWPIGAYLGADYFMSARFNPEPPPHGFAKPHDALEAQRQDLSYFRTLLSLDRSFTAATRAEADRRIAALEKQTTVLDPYQFRVALLRIVALADNGHSSLFSAEPNRANLVSVRVVPFADGLYVLRAKQDHADLLGARIEAVEGHPIEEVMTALSELRGGTPAWRRVYAALIVMSPGMIHGAGMSSDPARVTYTFRLPDGTTVDRTLTAYQPGWDEPFSPSALWLSTKRYKDEPEGWRPLIADEAKLPLSLRDLDKVFRRAWVGDTCVLYIQMQAVQDERGESISDFLAATESEMRDKQPCAVILDERFNGGGDYTNVWDFSRRLPDLIAPDGRIYILTTADTFSAAITMTGFVKEAAPDRTTILGEPVGDRMSFLSEGGHGCLPNAKLCVHYATGRHDYSGGCTEDCYWLNWFFPVRVKSFAPDETIPFRFADYAAGRDPVFDRAVTLATARR